MIKLLESRTISHFPSVRVKLPASPCNPRTFPSSFLYVEHAAILVANMPLSFRAVPGELFKWINMETLISADVLIPASICTTLSLTSYSHLHHPLFFFFFYYYYHFFFSSRCRVKLSVCRNESELLFSFSLSFSPPSLSFPLTLFTKKSYSLLLYFFCTFSFIASGSRLLSFRDRSRYATFLSAT